MTAVFRAVTAVIVCRWGRPYGALAVSVGRRGQPARPEEHTLTPERQLALATVVHGTRGADANASQTAPCSAPLGTSDQLGLRPTRTASAASTAAKTTSRPTGPLNEPAVSYSVLIYSGRLAMGVQRGKVDNRVRERHREPEAAQRYSQARESPRSRRAQIMDRNPDARHHAAIAEQGSGPHGGDQDQTGDAKPDRPGDLQRAGRPSGGNRGIGPLLRVRRGLRVGRRLSARGRLRCHLRLRRRRRFRLSGRAGPGGQSRKDRRGKANYRGDERNYARYCVFIHCPPPISAIRNGNTGATTIVRRS